jgi:hypothetical protein
MQEAPDFDLCDVLRLHPVQPSRLRDTSASGNNGYESCTGSRPQSAETLHLDLDEAIRLVYDLLHCPV